MSDRLDIDALLIGSLYGELGSADEARLQAHLESHPADRTALADLTYARTAVRESRIFQVQAEPPQQISALLMQEAARRAPKQQVEREGWMARFVASLRHPAMAAAAMLVVVVGVAGTLYVRNGDQFAAQTKSASEASSMGASPATADQLAAGSGSAHAAAAPEPVATGAVAPEGGAAATDDFRVSLEEAETSRAGDGRVAQETSPPKGAAKRQGTIGGLEVTTPKRRPMPKDLASDEEAAPRKFDYAEPRPEAKPAKPTTADRSRGDTPSDPQQAAPPPPAPATGFGADRGGSVTARAPGAAPPPPAETRTSKPAADKISKESSVEVAWAKSQHVKVAERVRAGKCGEAATLAVQLSNRVPSYYQQYVENDRDLKSCFTTINRERELDAERVQKRARPAGTK